MTSLFSCLCSGGFEKDRSIRRDWSFPHSPPLDPDLSDVEEEDDKYYTYAQKGATNTVALGGPTTKVVYTNDDDDGGADSGYISHDDGICYGNGENNSVNDSVNGVDSTPTVDGGYEYDDGGGDNGYASADGGEEDGGDDYYSRDGGSSFRGGDYESA
ncbi:hypothetical protein R3W88_020525 [Solanum pinnatisectum]|uniref:Uncharacterized protein n=1 Tax=Solanum pinnatisectum TaxID=50273 RepID=A0AAV9KN99_9SOLN|nr:hypothetical protein R3W88_020525 [Solanum pinnatisectum]